MTELAVKKLDSELAKLSEKNKDRRIKLMAPAVHAALAEFCRQDEEFAQAVYQGGTFKDCMAAVVQGIKNNSISDLDAYRLAVQYYFPGADIRCQMTINLCADVERENGAAPMVLDLFDLL